MRNQTIIWTALPNGVDSNGKLHLSVFVSPRLGTETGAPDEPEVSLNLYPDFIDWPSTLGRIKFSIVFEGCPQVLTEDGIGTLSRIPHKPLANIGKPWEEIFGTFPEVEAYKYEELKRRPIVPDASSGLLNTVRGTITNAAATASSEATPSDTRSPLLVRSTREVLFSRIENKLRANESIDPDSPPSGINQDQWRIAVLLYSINANKQSAATVAVKAHRPLDFHGIVSSLGEYPELLRALGLIIDFELATHAEIKPASRVSVRPEWSPSLPQTINSTPWTSYVLTADRFLPSPRKINADIVDGLINFTNRVNNVMAYRVSQLDPVREAINLSGSAEGVIEKTNTGKSAHPLMTSSGIAVFRSAMGKQLANDLAVADANNKAIEENRSEDITLTADDVVRGYRVDVHVENTDRWRSLHERIGKYTFVGTDRTLEIRDEGWVSIGTVEMANQLSTKPPMQLSETLFRWEGWSLSSPRLGKAILANGAPGDVTNTDAVADNRLHVEFSPVPKSLPRLRFGNRYRFRLRIVDIAGNSILIDSNDVSVKPRPKTETDWVTYGRFEPVPPPALVLRNETSPGESVDRLVIRSDFDGSSTEVSERFVVPSQAAQSIAETHGRFDVAVPLIPATGSDISANNSVEVMNKSAYNLITKHEGSLKEYYAEETIEMPYLPDPLAHSAIARGLPGLDSSEPCVMDFSAGASWPNYKPWRIRIEEGTTGSVSRPAKEEMILKFVNPFSKIERVLRINTFAMLRALPPEEQSLFREEWRKRQVEVTPAPPQCDDRKRLLTVFLPKAEVCTAILSSRITPQDLELLGVWHILKGSFRESRESLKNQILDGCNQMFTPCKNVILVHAVQQPLFPPMFQLLPPTLKDDRYYVDFSKKCDRILNRIGGFIISNGKVTDPAEYTDEQRECLKLESKLNKPRYIVPVREEGATHVDLYAGIWVPGKSASRVDIKAEWKEIVDDGKADSSPREITSTSHVFSITLDEPRDTVVPVVRKHDFGDTKYRRVTYTAIATTRFREYFDISDQDIATGKKPVTRASAPVTIDIPNSSPPTPPHVLYVVPTFGWGAITAKGNTRSRTRSGNGLRVYLDRTWYESGDGEMLGVVYFETEGGRDPIWQLPSKKAFSDYTSFGVKVFPLMKDVQWKERFPELWDSYKIPDLPFTRVAPHVVGFSEEHKLWYCDIVVELDNIWPFPGAYHPFIRLAFARVQPNSIPQAVVSDTVIAGFAQLMSDRTASYTIEPANGFSVGVAVDGKRWNPTNRVEAVLERFDANIGGDFGWVTVRSVQLTRQADPVLERYAGGLGAPETDDPHRVVFKEYEIFREGANEVKRLVYADTLNL